MAIEDQFEGDLVMLFLETIEAGKTMTLKQLL
jgi:hypothetical protein